jgi:hypothetical protein
VAFILLPSVTARLFLPPMRATWHEEAQAKMMKLVRQILVLAMLVVASAGAFAQRKDKDKDKRPPKEPVVVITNDRKDNRPPPRDNRPKQDNRKKPD